MEDQGWYECRVLFLDQHSPEQDFANGSWVHLTVNCMKQGGRWCGVGWGWGGEGNDGSPGSEGEKGRELLVSQCSADALPIPASAH